MKIEEYSNRDYWRCYYPPEVLARCDALLKVTTIPSAGINLHLDLYRQPDPDAPVVILNHGAAGYCRLFVALALGFYEQGYTVILLDQYGQGYSGGRRGDYTIQQCTENILDVLVWAHTEFENVPLYMLGGSVGGGLTYYAAGASIVGGGPVLTAVSCLNLFDFGNGSDGLLVSTLAPLVQYPRLAQALNTIMQLSEPIGWLRVPFHWFGKFDKLMDARDAKFQAKWDADPVPGRLISLRSLTSNLHTPPAIPFEANQTPVLVINQREDQMVDPRVTRSNYARLAGPKQYLEIPYGHFSNQPDFWASIIEASHAWFQEHRGLRSVQRST